MPDNSEAELESGRKQSGRQRHTSRGTGVIGENKDSHSPSAGECRSGSKLDRIARSFDSEEVAVLAVDVDESRKTVAQYLKASPRSCPIILSGDTTLMPLLTKESFPTYVVINSDGQIAGTRRGEIGEQGMRKLLTGAGVKAD